jgi:hypothetical protein
MTLLLQLTLLLLCCICSFTSVIYLGTLQQCCSLHAVACCVYVQCVHAITAEVKDSCAAQRDDECETASNQKRGVKCSATADTQPPARQLFSKRLAAAAAAAAAAEIETASLPAAAAEPSVRSAAASKRTAAAAVPVPVMPNSIATMSHRAMHAAGSCDSAAAPGSRRLTMYSERSGCMHGASGMTVVTAPAVRLGALDALAAAAAGAEQGKSAELMWPGTVTACHFRRVCILAQLLACARCIVLKRV